MNWENQSEYQGDLPGAQLEKKLQCGVLLKGKGKEEKKAMFIDCQQPYGLRI